MFISEAKKCLKEEGLEFKVLLIIDNALAILNLGDMKMLSLHIFLKNSAP